ncbi:MAG: chemotaxis protein CheW [Armatimonadota bacterium]|nr:chemotaxis protein CheW [Armatimonadota bacterium]
MDRLDRLVIFTVEGRQSALPLSAVERVVRVVEVTPLPEAPDIVLGVINVQGQVIPVISLRRLLRLPERELELSDQLIIARTSRRPVALVADAVRGVMECAGQEVVAPEAILPGLEYVEGVVKSEDELIFIYNLDAFLSFEVEKTIEAALESEAIPTGAA